MSAQPERRATDEPQARPAESDAQLLSRLGWRNVMSVYWIAPGTTTPLIRVDMAARMARAKENLELKSSSEEL